MKRYVFSSHGYLFGVLDICLRARDGEFDRDAHRSARLDRHSEGEGDERKLTVSFQDYGPKKLIERYANLQFA